MNWLYRILDVGAGVELAVNDARRIRTPMAVGVALLLDLLLCIILGWAWWTYDLHATWEWAGPLGAGWATKLPERLQPYNQWFIFVLNAAPTLIQWRFPSLSRRHPAAFWVFAAAACFDIVTDYPAVKGDVDLYLGGILSQFSLGTLLLWGAYFVGTILASFVLQSLVIIHAAKVLALLGQSGAPQGMVNRMQARRAGARGYYDDDDF